MDPTPTLRYLWAEHVARTRDVLFGESPGALLANQDKIGAVFSQAFGEQTGHAVAALLRQHILGAISVVTEMKKERAHAGSSQLASAVAAWKKNASDIATALAAIGPAFDYATLNAMLQKHLQLLSEEAGYIVAGSPEGSRPAFYQSLVEADDMAMAMGSAIAQTTGAST